MKIGEVATLAGVTVDTVRFYERVGVLPPPARRESGYRDFAPARARKDRAANGRFAVPPIPSATRC